MTSMLVLCLASHMTPQVCAQAVETEANIDQAFVEAGNLIGQRNFVDAKRVLDKALVDARAANVGHTAQMARLLQWLSGFHNVDSSNSRRDAQLAIAQSDEAISIRRELFGPNDLAMAGALRDKALIEGWSLGDFEASVTTFRQAVEIYRLHGDAQRSQLYSTLISLGAAQSNLGDLAGEQRSSREALALLPQLGHMTDASSLRTIARLHQVIGEIDQCVAYSVKALDAARSAKPPDHRATAAILDDLGSLYASLSLDARAADYFRQALQLRERHFSTEPLDVYRIRLADILVSNLHQYDEAIALYEKVRVARITVEGAKSLPVAEVLQAEGFVQLRLRNYPLAESKYLEALAIRDAIPQPSVALDRARLRSHLALAQLYQEQPTQMSKAAAQYAIAEGLVQGIARNLQELTDWDDSRIGFYANLGEQGQILLHRFKFFAARPDLSFAATNLASTLAYWQENDKPSPRTAIARLFYKLGLQRLELQRSQVSDPNAPILREYDEHLKSTYSGMADLLIASGRIVEAERIMMLLHNVSVTPKPRAQVNALALTDDEEEIHQQVLELAAYYRNEVAKIQRDLPVGESLRSDVLRSVQKRYALIDRQLLTRLLALVTRWHDDDYQLYASPFQAAGAMAQQVTAADIADSGAISMIPQPADIRRALDLLAQTRLTKSWGDPLNGDELAAARFVLGAYDQRWQNIGRYWANRQILPILRSGMSEEQKHRVKNLRIRVQVNDALLAKANIADGEIEITTALIRALYDLVSAVNWVREYDDLSKYIFSWSMVAAERSRNRSSLTDTSLYFDFLDYAKAAKRPDRAKYINVANDISEVYQAFAFMIGHEICHFILGHRPFGENTADVARTNEADADKCASERLEAAGYDRDYATIALQVLMVNGFTKQGQFVWHATHPHTMCRVAPYLKKMLMEEFDGTSAYERGAYLSFGFSSSNELADALKDMIAFFEAAGRESCENREPSIEPNARVGKLLKAIGNF
ncbi:tetratricopeptide repeat protein [Azonexus caeni]|uniref:tetratricopeptide repeat protein n=1 Tax=Azonexus caeni TaxID=266126 RepID=UPI003A8376D9